VDTVEKIKMINKDKNKQEESLINNLRLSWNLVNNLSATNFSSKFQIEKLVFMVILLTITAFFNQLKTAL
jgi:hypothetical protein